MSKTFEKHAVTTEFAQQLVDAAVAKAKELKVPQCVAIVDEGGNLKAFLRMDGAALIPIEIAQSKAYTALFGVPTHEFFNFIKGDPALVAGIPGRARVAAFGGGYPIKVGGEIVGAIGVSGGTVEQDMQCAEAALKLVQ
ncbi:MAG TPA: heme-binding protein [Candidatus Binataceae bacterium]